MIDIKSYCVHKAIINLIMNFQKLLSKLKCRFELAKNSDSSSAPNLQKETNIPVIFADIVSALKRTSIII